MLKSQEILKQEEKFLALNAEIDMQTKTLLEEVAHLKKSNENPTESSLCTGESETKPSNLANDCEFLKNFPVKIPQINYDLTEYFNRIKMQNDFLNEAIKNDEKLGIEKETLFEKNVRQKRKTSSSAKILNCSLNTTNLVDQAVFPTTTTKNKSNVLVKYGNSDGDLISEAAKGMGQEGMVRFLTAKVKVLSDQIQMMQKEEKKMMENIKELQMQKDKALEDKDRLIQQVNSAKNVLVKCEQNAKSLATQLQTSQTENNHLKKEVENLKKEIRQNKQNYNANELKLNRISEESERLKATIQQMKQDEKELKESSRKKVNDLTTTIKKADKQRMELLNGFKKQMIIIDNLKRQKGLIEAAKLLKSAEDDFINFLDCNPSG